MVNHNRSELCGGFGVEKPMLRVCSGNRGTGSTVFSVLNSSGTKATNRDEVIGSGRIDRLAIQTIVN
ncbi:hypothetical protein BGAL_0054g00200 [Botrytis galanthina]|uniref:Uncharacterized protein n=1 Tax=Botrytis galanthina TaxID=278940 RepID=A0A4S8RFM5_9HELO|nr:hypothetical protein BGAL_0054g00200 [Botrytis galanthina]